MEQNFFGGLTLNTPEFFAAQQSVAVGAIGSNMLIAARYKNGVAIGHKFNKNQNNPREWIEEINEASLAVGWGDHGHFRRLCSLLRRLILEVKDRVSGDYVTNFYLINQLALVLESASQNSKPCRVSFLFVDLNEEKLVILHFDGKMMTRSQFGILGGYEYQDLRQMKVESDFILAKHGIKQNKLPINPLPGIIQELDDAYYRSIKSPLKDAIIFLENIYGERDFLDTKDEAIDAIKNALLKYDPPSKKETFEITVIEGGNLESIYFKREKKESLPCIEVEFTPIANFDPIDEEASKKDEEAGKEDDENKNKP